MPAHSKTELIDITQKDFGKLEKLIETIPPDVALQKDADDTSIKDVIAHRAHWIDLFLGWYWDGRAGKTVHFPAEGYKWNELKRYNADLRQRQSHLDWPQAVNLLKKKHGELTGFINDRSDDELYGGPMKGAQNDWRSGRWAEAAGPSHYRSAAKYIRAALRARG
ncbi:ClbS/DfsB family four-helix bundle protein [uncultured Tateyamaria sp.]|uniref:ClbS/DfsB family four-helix bundle protein n=1 Tax=uncultured Tateyamaria sp. TaxID=455651 RepID=UPI00262F9C6E|nr:ClbS/DfsB family four-helix bundle protein [uncultured Tateyamaria sp.]